MAAAILDIVSETVNTAPDLTALTGGQVGWDTLAGFKGADYFFLQPGNLRRVKHSGGDQVILVGFNDTGSAVTQANTPTGSITVTAYDMRLANIDNGNDGQTPSSFSSNQSTAFNLPASQIDSGIRFQTPITADQYLRTLHVHGYVGKGTWVAKVAVADASLTQQTLTLSSNAYFGLKARVRTLAPTTMSFEIRRTATGTGSYDQMWNITAWLEPWVKPKPPRGAHYAMLWGGLYGDVVT